MVKMEHTLADRRYDVRRLWVVVFGMPLISLARGAFAFVARAIFGFCAMRERKALDR